MPAPSPLSIATSAVTRLLKEEITYRKELSGQEQSLKRKQEDVKDEDPNRDFNIKQLQTSMEETKAVFGPLRERIVASTEKLESILADSGDDADPKQVEAAREAVMKAKESYQ